MKSIRKIIKSRIVLFVVSLPITNVLLISECIGNDPTEVKLAIVNEEFPDIWKCEWVQSTGCNFSAPLSCRYLKKLQQEEDIYELKEYSTIKEAKHAVKENKVWGLIYFSKNYTASLNERIAMSSKTSNISIAQSEIEIWLDMSNQYLGNFLKRYTTKACIEFLKELYSDCGWASRAVDTPVQLQSAVIGDNNVKFRHSVSYSVVTSFQFYLPMQFMMESVLMERSTGSLDRILISGITWIEIAVSIIIIQYIILFMQTTAMMLIVFVWYDSPIIAENLPWIALLLFLIGSCGMCYGFLIGIISTNEQMAIFMGLGSAYGNFFISGAMWPLDGMQKTMRGFCITLPVTQSAMAFQALAVKDWSISDVEVYQGFLITFGWICVYFLLSSIVIIRSKGLAFK